MSVLRSFLAGKEARRQQDAEDRMSAQRDYLFQNSEGIMSGDQGALGGLARFDPMMALSIDSTHQANRRQDAAAARAAAAEDRAQQAFDANMSAAEAAEAAAELERGIQMGLATQSPEQWDTLMGRSEETQQFVGQFESREQIAKGLLPIVEQLKMRAGPQPNFERVGGSFVDMNNPGAGAQPIPNLPASEPTFRAATPEEAQARGAEAGQIDKQTGRFYPAPSGTPLVQIGGFDQGSQQPTPVESEEEPLDPQAVQDAFGLDGVVRGAANAAGDFVGMGLVAPEVQRVQSRVNKLNTDAMLTLSAAYPGRPSNLTREKIEAILPKLKQGPETALNDLNEVISTLTEQVQRAEEALNSGGLSDSDRSQAVTFITNARGLSQQYRAIRDALVSANELTSGTTGGVQWRIVE